MIFLQEASTERLHFSSSPCSSSDDSESLPRWGKLSHFYLLSFSDLILSNHRFIFGACECYPSVGIKKISSVLIFDFVDTKGLDVSIYSLFLAISHVLHALVDSRRDYIIVVQPGLPEQCLVKRVGIDDVELRL